MMKSKKVKGKNGNLTAADELLAPFFISNKQLLEMIVALFKAKPEYRDMRMETIMYIVEKICENVTNLEYIIITAFNADRYFRHIQQKVPALRGKTWKSRQLMAGEKLNSYELTKAEITQAEEVFKQLKLF